MSKPVLSLGAGRQSSTLALMGAIGEIELGRAIFADTQDEPAAVYRWLETLTPILERAGIPVDVVTAGDLRDDSLHKPGWLVSMPLHIVSEGRQPAMLSRKCTNGYKIRPIQRRLREIGATAKNPATLLIGISRDEAQRMKPARVKYIRHEFPLIDKKMTVTDCVTWLADHGYPEPPKSSCRICPFRGDRGWRQMRDEAPADFASAVEFDRQVRDAAQLKVPTKSYLHRSLIPLDMVDLSTPRERQSAAGQIDMFEIGECDGFSCMGDAS